MTIGAAEYKRKKAEINVGAEGGGAPAQNQVVVEMPVLGAIGIMLKNQGDEVVTYEVLSRGKDVAVVGENIAPLQVGATDQFQGLLANRRIVPGTLDILDVAGAQSVVDDGVSVDGIGQIVDKAVPATVVGTINYETGYIDFTWMAAFGAGACTGVYTHRGWTSFATPITGTLAVGGGEDDIILMKAAGVNPADNYADGVKNNTWLGVMMYSAGQGSDVKVAVDNAGDVDFKLVPPARFRNLNSPLTQP